MTSNRFINIILIFLGGFLFSLGFEPVNFILGPMIGLVPLLAVENKCSLPGKKWRKWKVFGSAFVFFATFNAGTIWWVWNASFIGVLASVVVNSLFFAGVFTLFSSAKKYLGARIGYLSLLVFWVTWEYVELLDWDLSWPWMTLGFSLAGFPKLIQWFEYSGSLGGSLWLLVINLMVYFWWRAKVSKNEGFYKFKRFLYILYVIFPPILISLLIYWTYEEGDKTVDVVVVQPNKEAYSGQYLDKNQRELNIYGRNRVHHIAGNAFKKIDGKVDYVFFPETALTYKISNKRYKDSPDIIALKQYLEKYPNLKLITGIKYKEDIEPCDRNNLPFDASISRDGICFRNFNSAIQLQKDRPIDLYHKSRLVIGVERIPSYFIPLEKYLTDFSNKEDEAFYNTNNGIQVERDVFFNRDSTLGVAPIICYESVFGEYVGDYVNNGAQFLAIITNDGWWGDTPGYKQHWSFARLRAIETRRSVARSANTGTSGFISELGEDMETSEWMVPDVLRREITLNTSKTFYTRFGDILGRGGVGLSFIILLNLIIRIIRKEALV